MAALLPSPSDLRSIILFQIDVESRSCYSDPLTHIFIRVLEGTSYSSWMHSVGVLSAHETRGAEGFYYSYTPHPSISLNPEQKEKIAAALAWYQKEVSKSEKATLSVIAHGADIELRLDMKCGSVLGASSPYVMHEGPFREALVPFTPKPLPAPWHDLHPSHDPRSWALSMIVDKNAKLSFEKLVSLWQSLAASLVALPPEGASGIIKAGEGQARSVIWRREAPSNLWILYNRKKEGDTASSGTYKIVTDAYNMRTGCVDVSLSMQSVLYYEEERVYFLSPGDEECMKRELYVYKELKGNPAILPLHEAVTYPHAKAGLGHKMRLVVPKATATLFELMSIVHAKPPLERMSVCLALAEMLETFHASGYAHGDLKPSNVVVIPTRDGRSQKSVLIDFGTAHKVKEGEKADYLPTTIYYAAPELAQIYLDEGPSTPAYEECNLAAADMWSLGVIFFEILKGKSLVDFESPMTAAALMLTDLEENWFADSLFDMRHTAPEKMKSAFDIMDKMTSPDPTKRPSAAEVVAALQAVIKRG